MESARAADARVHAKLYFYKPVFQLKMLLFVGAVLIQFTVLRRLAERASANPLLARTTVAAAWWRGRKSDSQVA